MKAKFVALLGAMAFAAAQPGQAASIVYDNGAVNGTAGALSLVWGWAAANSFTLSSTTNVTGITFGAWVAPGNNITAIDWGINDVSPPNFVSNGTAAITSSSSAGNNGNYDLYSYTFSIPTMTLGAGTYYISLQNAASLLGGAVYWDLNFGPSVGYSNAYGSVASESFQVLGDVVVQDGGDEGNGSSGVPEPASWVMMVGGFCLAGVALRGRRRASISFAG